MGVDVARKVADTVLYEGYVLYPYRASATKNQARWQFGVVVPRGYSESGSSEPWFSQTECLIEPRRESSVHVKLRFLQVQSRSVEEAVAPEEFRPAGSLEVNGQSFVTWDEAAEQEVDVTLSVADLVAGEHAIPVEIAEGREFEPLIEDGRSAGRLVRTRWPISAVLRVSAESLDGPFPVVKLRLRVENLSPWSEVPGGRKEALKRSLVAAHTVLSASGAEFVSLLEPPEWAAAAAQSCDNVHTWPVLIGEPGRRDVMLSSPIILYDYPEIAPESQGDLYDATEIDEILTLRTMALTDAEKREARITDPRAAGVIDRVDAMPPEMLEKLHGAVRYMKSVTDPVDDPSERVPWWDPGADSSVSPESDEVWVAGLAVSRGSRVCLRPGFKRADAQDMFLEGRTANVEAVLSDVDGNSYLAVTLEDDPAADLQQSHGRFLYFSPDEIEPLEDKR